MTKKNIFMFVIIAFMFSLLLSGCVPEVVTEKELIVDYENVVQEVEYGSILDLTGLQVKVKMSDGTYKYLKNEEGGYTIEEEYNNLEAGNYTITVSYKNFDSVNFPITVLEEEIVFQDDEADTITGIIVDDTVGKKIFEFGEVFSTENIVVEKMFVEGENETLEESEYTVDSSNYNEEIAGQYTIVVTLNSNEEISCTYTVTVLPQQ